MNVDRSVSPQPFAARTFSHDNRYKADPRGSQKGASFFSGLEKQRKKTASSTKPKQGVDVTTYTDKEGRVHKTFTGKGTDVIDSMQKAINKAKDNKPTAKKRLNYSYQKVSNQVLMAKNSLSASKAVLSAMRALSDLKRALRTAECSDDEKQAALTHATRMLQIAKKKRNNLELEEMVSHTISQDEQAKRLYDQDITISSSTRAKGDEDALEKPIDQDLEGDGLSDDDQTLESLPIEEALDEYDLNEYTNDEYASDYDIDDELSQELAKSLDQLLEEAADMMQEGLDELMDAMEVVNPHMDREDLEKLKNKHRCDEQKEIVKADTDYLKEYIRILKQEATTSNTDGNGQAAATPDMTASANPAAINVCIAVDSSLGFNITC